MRASYYWLTLESDCIKYARKCHKCQIYADKIHVPPIGLHVMTLPWPFSMWGMDVIGPITPKAFNRYRFIFMVIDYFIKWVEAVSYASVTRSVICKFIKKEIICRYRIPKRIIFGQYYQSEQQDDGTDMWTVQDKASQFCTIPSEDELGSRSY